MSTTPHAVLCDLDGVVWLAHQPIPGSVEAIARLRSVGHRVLFVTNNSSATVETQESVLASIGIPASGDVLTSAMAAASLVQPGEAVLVCGGPGIVQALEQRGARPLALADVGSHAVDVVMVGFHRTFDYEAMRIAAHAIRGGARLIGTNDDATYPTPEGPIPGGGAILAAVATASGVVPLIAGKPHQPMADLVRQVVPAEQLEAAVMVGDRADTDGLFARRLRVRYAQVWSGVTPSPTGDEAIDQVLPPTHASPRGDLQAASLSGVAALLGQGR